MSPYFNFLKNMWVMRKCDEVYLQARVAKDQISQVEYEEIINAPQIEIEIEQEALYD